MCAQAILAPGEPASLWSILHFAAPKFVLPCVPNLLESPPPRDWCATDALTSWSSLRLAWAGAAGAA